MAFDIPRDQQKLFIEHFMKQVLDVAMDLVQNGKGQGSPGETIHKVGRAVIAQLYGMGSTGGGEGEESSGPSGGYDA